jgi:hypothetical protein
MSLIKQMEGSETVDNSQKKSKIVKLYEINKDTLNSIMGPEAIKVRNAMDDFVKRMDKE